MAAVLDRVVVRGVSEYPEKAWGLLAREFPTVRIERDPDGAAGRPADLTVERWEDPALDLRELDRRLDRVVAERRPLVIAGSAARPELDPAAVLAILTRAQRVIGRRNRSSASLFFDGLLARHRDLHDLAAPLARASYHHALDVWQWALRLNPDASLALQLAALFHGLERLRGDPRAGDYPGARRRQAREGARFAVSALAAAGVHPAVLERTGRLIAAHDEPAAASDRELAQLVDAEALSFFSLESAGFLDAHGPAHARQRVTFTLARLSPDGRSRLAQLRLRPGIERLVGELLPGIPPPAVGLPPAPAAPAARPFSRPLIPR